MKTLLVLAGLLIAGPALGAELSRFVDHVVDGDTLWVCNDDACTKIRLCVSSHSASSARPMSPCQWSSRGTLVTGPGSAAGHTLTAAPNGSVRDERHFLLKARIPALIRSLQSAIM